MGTKYYPVIDVIATGKNILRLRKAQGYSVADLQEFLGFEAPQAIYKWQSGKSLPSTDNLFALSVFFEVSIEDILVAEKPKFQVVAQEESCDPVEPIAPQGFSNYPTAPSFASSRATRRSRRVTLSSSVRSSSGSWSTSAVRNFVII